MKLAVIGVGLIGGSFARAARAAGKVSLIVGFDSHSDGLRRALELGVIDQRAESAAQAVAGADLVVIAIPIGSMREVLREIAPHLPVDAIVTDVGSTKADVIECARDQLGAAFARFVAAHPIAGSEQSGVEHSDTALFLDRLCVTTPVAQTEVGALQRVEALWSAIGCRIERMTAEEHDRVMAAVSHLPHLLAFALVAQIAGQSDASRKFALAGPGFRDFTRIAGSDASMWSEICVSNRVAIGQQLRAHRELLEELQRALDRGERDALRRVFARAESAWRQMPDGR